MDRYKLKEAAYTIISKMLDSNDKDNLQIVYMDKHGIFSIDEEYKIKETIVDTSSILDIEYLNTELKNINRVKLCGDTYRTVKIKAGYKETKNGWMSSGNYAILSVEEVKVIGDKSEILINNISQNSTSANDMAIALLQLCKFTKGYIDMQEQTIYGTDRFGNNKFIGYFDLNWFSGAKKLTFDELGMGYTLSKTPNDTMRYIKLPYSYHNDISKNLEKALDANGIIVIEDMIANNVIDSIIKLKEDKSNQVNFIYIGNGIPTLNSNIGNIQNYGLNNKSFNDAVLASNNNIILDPQNLLSMERLINLSETNIVIVNSNDKTIYNFYKRFDSVDESLRKSFTSRLKYFGNPEEKESDLFIDKLERELLFLKEYELVDDIINSYSSIYPIIYTLIYKAKGVNRIYNTGNCVSLEYIKDGKVEYNKLNNIQFTKSHIIELLVNNLGVNINTAIEILNSKKDYTGMMRMVVNNQITLLRVNIVKSSLGIPSLYLSVIPRASDEYKINDLWEHNLNLVVGKRGSGKTDKVRANIPENENIYIFDSDYEFSELEFEDYHCKSIIIERESPDINIIRQINPSIVIINSTISVEQLLPILTLANRGMKVLICLTIVNYTMLKEDTRYQELIKNYELNPKVIL